jgi:hypothetical protein
MGLIGVQKQPIHFSGSDFIVPLSMEGVPHKAARALVKAGKQGVHSEVETFNAITLGIAQVVF